MRILLGLGRALLVVLFVLCCLAIVYFIFPRSDLEKKGAIIKRWCRRFLDWIGIRVNVSGDIDTPDAQVVGECGVTPGRKGRLIVSNHISFLDIFALNSVLPSAFIAKEEIRKWPVFGAIARGVDTIFINRGNRRALVQTEETVTDAISSGRSVLLFPEGTTSDGTGLLKLHANLFEPAARNTAPVVPVVLTYTSRGERSTAVAYIDGVGIFQCLWRAMTTPELAVNVSVQPSFAGDSRRELCARTEEVMRRGLSLPVPAAEEQDKEKE